MHAKTKDRLMTAGTVLVICALGFTQGGCVLAPQSQSQREAQRYWNSVCTTDMDCEMHAAKGTRHSEGEGEGWTWRKTALVVGGVLVAGYFAEKQLDNSGGGNGSAIDIKTPGVNCAANGCAK